MIMDPSDEASANSYPIIEVSVGVILNADVRAELTTLVEACKGDKRDRFGHIKYWKGMLALIPIIISQEVRSNDMSKISEQTGFSPDQIRRSLDRFVDKGVLVKEGLGHSYTWKLNQERFPALSLLSKKRLPPRMVPYYSA